MLDYINKIPPNIQSIQNLTLVPSIRYVYAPEWLLKNIIRECCAPTSTSIFCLDTTYDVGKFYVTPTVYVRYDVICKKTGKPAVFPGPAMFHVNKTGREYFYFGGVLVEINKAITTCRFIGGDRDAAQQSFLLSFTESTLLPCTKQVKDDIGREIDELQLSEHKEEYVDTIFGSMNVKG